MLANWKPSTPLELVLTNKLLHTSLKSELEHSPIKAKKTVDIVLENVSDASNQKSQEDCPSKQNETNHSSTTVQDLN